MFSLFKLLFELLISSKNDSEFTTSDSPKQHNINIPSSDGKNLEIISGSVFSTVTHICGNDGLLDNEIYFNCNSLLSRDKPVIGDKVTAVITRRNGTSGWRATQISMCGDTTWDNNDNPNLNYQNFSVQHVNNSPGFPHSHNDTPVKQSTANKDPKSNNNEVKSQVSSQRELLFGYICHVTCSFERGSIKTILCNNLYEFQHTDCPDWYVPIQGDCVKFYEGRRQDSVIAVDISPTRTKRFDASVRAVKSDHGYIDGDIFFTKAVCENGVMPAKFTQVTGVAVERSHATCVWRAITLQRVTQAFIPESPNSKKSDDKSCRGHGVVVCSDYADDPIVEVGEKTEIVLYVRNHGNKIHTLFGVSLDTSPGSSSSPICFTLKKLRHSVDSASLNQVNIDALVDVQVRLYPGTSVSLVLNCQSEHAGQGYADVCCDFGHFVINHRVCVSAIIRHLVPVKVEARSYDRRKGQGRHRGNPTKPDEWIVPGVKPQGFPSKAILPYDIPAYTVPDYMYDAISDIEKLTRVEPCLLQPLNIDNYKQKLRVLLYLEEIQSELEMAEFDMERCFMRVCGPYLGLKVEGLAEGRPSVLVGDTIVVKEPDSDGGPCYQGYVHEVLADEILIKFHSNFHLNYDGKDFNVRFIFNRVTIRRGQQSIDLAYALGQSVLFPSAFQPREPQWRSTANHFQEKQQYPSNKPMKFINTSLNDRQRCAVSRILLGQSRPTPYVIFGPPGTGKTVTLVEAILQIFIQLPSSRILACSPSNSSADLIAERLHESGWVTTADMVRINAIQRNLEVLSDKIRPYCSTDELKVASIYRIIVCTCSSAALLYPLGIRVGHFTHVFVDEAGQATEPECFIPLCLASGTHSQLVLSGDPMQLGPVLRSVEAKQYGLQQSYLERLTQMPIYRRNLERFPEEGYNPHLVTKLLVSYRAHPTLLKLPSILFYNDELESKADDDVANCLLAWTRLPNKNGFPLIFHGIAAEDTREGNSPSWFNPGEVVLVVQYIQALLKTAPCPISVADIGVITPYRKQVEKIRLLIEKLNIGCVKVGSVEEFQGQERKVIIISTVRSSPDLVKFDVGHNLGFLVNPKRFNVAISRARACLITVGNPNVLSQDENWFYLIEYCQQHGAYIGCDLPAIFNDQPSTNEEPTNQLSTNLR